MPNLEQRLNVYVPDAAFDLFIVFARFEYAMKRSGFVSRGRRGNAQADWNAFGDAVPDNLFDLIRPRNEIGVILRSPAATLMYSEDGIIEWSDPPAAPENFEQLLKQVKNIRNNLLHGNKQNIDRDRQLVGAALYILNFTYDQLSVTPGFQNFIDQF